MGGQVHSWLLPRPLSAAAPMARPLAPAEPQTTGRWSRSACGQEAPARTPSSRSAPGGQKPRQLGLPTQPSLLAQLSTSRITNRCCQQTKEPMSHAPAQGAVWVKSGPQNRRKRRQIPKSVKTSRPAGWSASGGAQVTERRGPANTGDRGESHPRQGTEKAILSSEPPNQNQRKAVMVTARIQVHRRPFIQLHSRQTSSTQALEERLAADSVARGVCASARQSLLLPGACLSQRLCGGGGSTPGSPATEAGSGSWLAGGEGKF